MMDVSALRRRMMARRAAAAEAAAGQRAAHQPLMADKSRVARVLFDPPDHEANLRFVRRELEKAKREAEDRWNFDFENEKPIEGGRFEWVGGPSSRPLLDDRTQSEHRLKNSLSSGSSSNNTAASASNSSSSQPAVSSTSASTTVKVSELQQEEKKNSSSEERVSTAVPGAASAPAASSATTTTSTTVCDKTSATDENDATAAVAAPVPVVRDRKKQSSSSSPSVQSTPRKDTPSSSRSRLKQNQITSELTLIRHCTAALCPLKILHLYILQIKK